MSASSTFQGKTLRTHRLCLAVAALFVLACGGGADPGNQSDAGVVVDDGGTLPDGGHPADGGAADGGLPVDGGTAPDGGSVDAGSGSDGGSTDAGSESDGGVDLCVDVDGDGHGEGCAEPTDCEDSDPDRYQVLQGYTDADLDGYTVEAPGHPVDLCSGATLASGYRADSQGVDCNDQNAALTTTCGAFLLQDIATPNPFIFHIVGSAPRILGKIAKPTGHPAEEVAFFIATTPADGTELWRTNGTEEGTWMVKDTVAGFAGPTFGESIGLNSKFAYVSDDGLHGPELWFTDGTSGGTTLPKELLPGPVDTKITVLQAAQDRAFFYSSDNDTADHLITVSDGTAGGTRQIPQTFLDPWVTVGSKAYWIYPTSSEFQLRSTDGTAAGTGVLLHTLPEANQEMDRVVSAGGKLFIFSHKHLYTSNCQLWVSNGTASAPQKVFDGAAYDSLCSRTYFFRQAGNRYFFMAQTYDSLDGLFRTTGTPGDRPYLQHPMGSSPAIGETAALGNRLVYAANVTHEYMGNAGRWQLWASAVDGAGEAMFGAQILADFGTGVGNQASELTTVGTKVFFVQDDAIHGPELWVTNGTPAGTALVKDIKSGAEGSGLTGLVAVNGKLLFTADDGVTGAEPWVSDGTAEGTHPLRQIARTIAESSPAEFVDFAGQILFSAKNTALHGAIGRELWKTDGTPAGTGSFKDLNPGVSDSTPQELTPLADTLYFSAFLSGSGREPWVSDGTPAGTVMLKDLVSGTGSSNPHDFMTVGANVIFVADTGSGKELWKTQGNEGSTVLLEDINPGASDSDPSQLTPLGDQVVFVASSPSGGRELWVTDGDTQAGTQLLKDINPSAASYPSQLMLCSDRIWFTANDGTHGVELWSTDGTALGTKLVSDIASGSASSSPQNLVCWNDAVYFSAKGSAGRELYRTVGDSLAAQLANINPDAVDSNPRLLTPCGTHLYFVADDGSVGEELWRTTDAVGTAERVKDIYAGAGSSGVTELLCRTDMLLFFATDKTHGRELWTSKGTAAYTTLLKDIYPGLWGSDPHGLFLAREDGVTLFFASDGAFGTELWRTDGTSAGTRLLENLTPHAQGTRFSTGLTRIGGEIYFGADEGEHGLEPWAINVSDL